MMETVQCSLFTDVRIAETAPTLHLNPRYIQSLAILSLRGNYRVYIIIPIFQGQKRMGTSSKIVHQKTTTSRVRELYAAPQR